MYVRYTTSAGAAAGVSLALLFLMQLLIAVRDEPLPLLADVYVPEILEVREEQPTEASPPKPTRVDPVEPLPDTQLETSMDDYTGPIVDTFDPPPIDGPDLGGGKFSFRDGDATPIAKVLPVYPDSAARRGLEGYVIVEFTITRKGTVENVVVLKSTHYVFERPAVRAVSKFRYKPRVINGRAIDVHGIKHRITFELEQ